MVVATNLAAWGGLLLSADALWWDDWIVFDATLEQTRKTAREAGLFWAYLLGILSRGGPTFVSIIALGAYLAASILMLVVLLRIPRISPAEALFGASVFASVPLMEARHAAVNVVYIVAMASVLGLWAVLTRSSPLRWRTILAVAPLVIVSSLVPSTGLFLVVPVLHFLWLRPDLGNPRTRTIVALALGLPVAQFVIQRLLLPAQGVYQGYNSIEPELLTAMSVITIWTGSLAVVAAILVWHRRHQDWLSGAPILLAGGTLCALALTPYIAVGEIPPWRGWNTRHELLLPIGAAFLASGLARIGQVALTKPFLRLSMAAAVLAMCTMSAGFSTRYLVDWQKKESLIELIRADAAANAADVVLFTDQTLDLNIFSKNGYSTYVWNGLMVRAFGDARRFAVRSEEELADLFRGRFDPMIGPEGLYYGASNFIRSDAYSLARVTITRSPSEPMALVLSSELEVLPRTLGD